MVVVVGVHNLVEDRTQIHLAWDSCHCSTSRTVAGCFKNSLCVGDAFELATVAELAIEAGVEAMIRALEKEVLPLL